VDVAMYYLRKKKKAGLLRHSFTIMSTVFFKYLRDSYTQFNASQDPGVFLKKKLKKCVVDHITGESGAEQLVDPWDGVDDVFIPVIDGGHWYLLVVNMRSRCITVYDSMSSTGGHQTLVDTEVRNLATFLPYVLHVAGVLLSNEEIFKVVHYDQMPQQDNG
jgi:hypothetical protein